MASELGEMSFADKIVNLLEDGNTVHALDLFTDNKNNSEIHNNSWDLVPVVAQFLTRDSEYSNVEVFKCCERLIDILAEQSKPEEVLLQFIEEIETASDDTKFLMLLKPLQKVLLRVPEKRLTSLAWCFNAIVCYLQKLETPEDFSLRDEERLLLDSNEIVLRITFLYSEVQVFCQTFISELQSATTRNIKERQNILCKFLIELLGKPLAFLAFDVYKNTQPRAREIAENLVEFIFSVICDPFVYLEISDGSHEADLVKPCDLSLGVFYFLVLSQKCCYNLFPKVYDSVYVLHNSLRIVTKLLSQENQFAVEKGVDLALALVENIDRLKLSYLLLDSEDHALFCKVLSTVIIHNEHENVRKASLKVLHLYLWAFEHHGRYLLIMNLMKNITHSGLKGNLITQYKEMISTEIKNGHLEALPVYYKGQKLFSLLSEFTLLKQKEETDMVNESDQIVSALNLLRYLIIVDKSGKFTLIDGFMREINCYTDYLRKGLKMSKAHYDLKIKEVKEETPEKEKEDCEVSVTVSGKSLVEMSNDQKISIMNMSLTTLDIVDSLLNRLVECIALRNACK